MNKQQNGWGDDDNTMTWTDLPKSKIIKRDAWYTDEEWAAVERSQKPVEKVMNVWNKSVKKPVSIKDIMSEQVSKPQPKEEKSEPVTKRDLSPGWISARQVHNRSPNNIHPSRRNNMHESKKSPSIQDNIHPPRLNNMHASKKSPSFNKPRRDDGVKRRTKVCRHLIQHGNCRYKSCSFAHTKQEFSPIPCVYGHKCRFIDSKCLFIHPNETVTKLVGRLNLNLQ